MKKISILVLTLSAALAPAIAHAEQNSGGKSDFRCVIGVPTGLVGKLSPYTVVTLKPGQEVAETSVGSDENWKKEFVDRMFAKETKACGKYILDWREKNCLAEVAKEKKEYSKYLQARRVLKMVRTSHTDASLDGLTSDNEAANSWTFKWNDAIPFSQGQNVHVVFGTEFSGPNFSGFERYNGFEFRDSSDLFVSESLTDRGQPGDGFSGLQLTCTRMDGKFEDPTVKAAQAEVKPEAPAAPLITQEDIPAGAQPAAATETDSSGTHAISAE